MSLSRLLPTLSDWLPTGDPRTPQQIAADVRDEMQFHLDLLTSEFEETGMNAENARTAAAQQFGDVDRYAAECVRLAESRRTLLSRLLWGTCLAALAVAIYSTFERQQLQRQVLETNLKMLQLQQEFAAAKDSLRTAAPLPPIKLADLAGVVADAKGEPLAGAQIVVILKTWPDGRYRQQDFQATTDEAGRYAFPDLVPANRQYGLNVEVAAAGHALQSRYLLKEGDADEPPAAVDFQLAATESLRLKFVDGAGQPVSGWSCSPSARRAADGTQHLVYHQGSQPFWLDAAPAEGIAVSWFAPGDQAALYLKSPAGKEQDVEFAVPKAGTVEVCVE